jgi:hypothetical protein
VAAEGDHVMAAEHGAVSRIIFCLDRSLP